MSADGSTDLRGAYARALGDSGAVTQPRWQAAFAAVPREVFVPRFFRHETGGGMRAVGEGDAEWLPAVYSDQTLVTQLDGDDTLWQQAHGLGPIAGRPTSSSTQPMLMGWMLDALDLADGNHVLEVGTGTGYNAALLCHGLGSEQVSTVDVDADVVERARSGLLRVGYRPDVAVADAAHGHPSGGPYDRIVATCSWPRVPLPWIQQTRPGGRVLTHLYTDLDAGALLLLTVRGDGTADGRFLPQYGAFMTRRDLAPPDTLALLRAALRSPEEGTRSRAEVPATELLTDDFPLYAALRVPDVAMHWFQPDGATAMQTWLLGRDGSWAHQERDGGELLAVQGGPRRLADEIDRAHSEWVALDRPARDRFGLTVGPDGHRLWLDNPDIGLDWVLD